ncbi:Hypothetical predicted protein [Mytilus galloprovincialis]|uniref:Short-chain collagen C4-like n=1 Tax=Mytilus galloprovincialis TaxID=29158 RepID=A0A8B6HSI5_MYTGA|nr:Hypothetical predicted protein [Mytilus galloprovincialis]
MSYLLVFINAIVVALMAMYVYENERKMEKMSTRHDLTEKEIDVLKIEAKRKEDQIKELLSTKAESKKLTQIENQQIEGTKKLTEIENQQIAGTRKLTEVENQQIAGTKKIAEVENQLLKSKEKGVTYIRWGKTRCDGSNTTETIYSGQVGGGHYTLSGASVNYICLPNDPDAEQPLKKNPYYAFLYGEEYEIFDHNQPKGLRSGIGQHDVACAACLTKSKTSSIMIPGRKTCYNGWTKEYEGILMAGYQSHPAASEYACVDRDAEAIAGGSKNENGILFYPVKTACGSLKCPPYAADTDVLCVVCAK